MNFYLTKCYRNYLAEILTLQTLLIFHSGLEWDDSVDVVVLQIVGGAGSNEVFILTLNIITLNLILILNRIVYVTHHYLKFNFNFK